MRVVTVYGTGGCRGEIYCKNIHSLPLSFRFYLLYLA